MNKCRGTLRIRSSTRRSLMPCSCRRCTSRSRVRAEVMPMPLSRGPSMKLLKLEPLLQFGQSGVTGQVDLQWSDGRKAFGHRMKIRAGPGVLPVTGITHPLDIATARILGLDDGLAAMPAAEASHLDAAQLTVRQIRHVDIENDRAHFRPLQPVLRHSLHELRRHLCSGGKIART